MSSRLCPLSADTPVALWCYAADLIDKLGLSGFAGTYPDVATALNAFRLSVRSDGKLFGIIFNQSTGEQRLLCRRLNCKLPSASPLSPTQLSSRFWIFSQADTIPSSPGMHTFTAASDSLIEAEALAAHHPRAVVWDRDSGLECQFQQGQLIQRHHGLVYLPPTL